MKRNTISLLFWILLNAAVLHSQTNAYAYGYFYAPDGNLALVNLVRTRDTAGVTTTRLFYTFCAQANTGSSCQQGDGLIPNNTLQGTVVLDRTKPDVMRLTVDTSAVQGYRNQLCTQGIDSFGDCLGGVPATGGLVSVIWTRTNEWANLYTSKATQYHFGQLTSTATSKSGGFSATQAGTMLGVNATAAGAQMITSADSQTLQDKFAARKVAIKQSQFR